jgi:hypothetical protein
LKGQNAMPGDPANRREALCCKALDALDGYCQLLLPSLADVLKDVTGPFRGIDLQGFLA